MIELRSPGLFSFSVVPQPPGHPDYISDRGDVLTRFQLAEKRGALGLLAHNDLAGKTFSGLKPGNLLVVRYQGGGRNVFRVVSRKRYRALSPESPYSAFLDLETERVLSAAELFRRIYDEKDRLVLQTCLEKGQLKTWGRLFVVAEPCASPIRPEDAQDPVSPVCCAVN
jgi:hypothetical protein